MSQRAPTDEEIKQMWIDAIAHDHKVKAERQRAIDAMRQAGIATRAKERQA